MAYGAILGQTPIIPENPQTIATNVTYNNSQTSSIITGTNVQTAIDQLFTSVSNGKSLIASAITDKGVSTSASDTFAQMATNIGTIETGQKVNIYTDQEIINNKYLEIPNYHSGMQFVFWTTESYYNYTRFLITIYGNNDYVYRLNLDSNNTIRITPIATEIVSYQGKQCVVCSSTGLRVDVFTIITIE